MSLEPVPQAPAAPDNAAAYRRALGAFATGVCVVTAQTDSGPMGITINSFTSVSLNPRLVLWCLDERSERWATFAAADRFAIHMLDADSESVARRFAKGLGRLDPNEVGFTERPGEAPRLDHAAARFDCLTHQRIQMGDHMIIIGEVVGYDARSLPALTYFRGAYGRAETP